MSKIFISHSSKDKSNIDELVISLRLLGCDVFYSSEASTNKIEFGEDFYTKIKTEISKSDKVIFMVSNDFYDSIPSLIELGIAYALEKDMIPVGFKSDNYRELLKGIFNTNNRLACLDNEDDVLALLSKLSKSDDILTIKNQAKIIFNKNNRNKSDNSIIQENNTHIISGEKLDNSSKEASIEYIVNKFKNLRDTDYILIKYIVETRTYSFNFANEYDFWKKDYYIWLKRYNLDMSKNYEGFLNYIKLLNQGYNSGEYLELSLSIVEALEYIYNRDSLKINEALSKNFDEIPF